jgi:hypothetical protein
MDSAKETLMSIRILSVTALLVLILAGCGFGPPPSCGEGIGGTADTARFDQLFTNMQLVDQGSGQPGLEGERGARFPAGAVLEIRIESRSEVAVRVCIQPGGPGELALDDTRTMAAGAGSFVIGVFEPGAYITRVIVDGVLVKNFPFEVR